MKKRSTSSIYNAIALSQFCFLSWTVSNIVCRRKKTIEKRERENERESLTHYEKWKSIYAELVSWFGIFIYTWVDLMHRSIDANVMCAANIYLYLVLSCSKDLFLYINNREKEREFRARTRERKRAETRAFVFLNFVSPSIFRNSSQLWQVIRSASGYYVVDYNW